jgi:hypothetical protein
MAMMTEYEKAIEFLKVGCSCNCSSKVPKEAFAEMREAFQARTRHLFNGATQGHGWWIYKF